MQTLLDGVVFWVKERTTKRVREEKIPRRFSSLYMFLYVLSNPLISSLFQWTPGEILRSFFLSLSFSLQSFAFYLRPTRERASPVTVNIATFSHPDRQKICVSCVRSGSSGRLRHTKIVSHNFWKLYLLFPHVRAYSHESGSANSTR